MASKRGLKRREKRKMCEGKASHPDEKGAWIARQKTGLTQLHAYRCKYCGFWHNGNMPAHVRRAMENRK